MRFRGKSIRRKIVGLLLVPLVSLTSIWSFAVVITGREAQRLLDFAALVESVGYPAENTVHMLQDERRQALVHLADPRSSDGLARLHRRERATDAVVERLRASAADQEMHDDGQADEQLTTLLDGLDGLDSLRRKVEEGTVSRNYAFAAYNALIDPTYDFLAAVHALEDVQMDKQARALIGVTRAREAVSREDALFASALAAGHLSRHDLRLFSDRVADRKLLYSTSLPVLPAEESAVYAKYWNSPDTVDLRSAEERILSAGPGRAALDTTDAARWQAAVGTVLADLDRMNTAAGHRYQDRVEPVAIGVLVKAGVAGVLGFAAVLVSLVVSVRIGRGLVRDLTRLRKEAHEASGVRLPSVMRRLAAGEQIDVETEAPRLEYGPDETGQVGQALNTLQRAAVEAAVKQAELRRGVSEVFVNLARRSQVLLHRQLSLLDTMERRTEDTDELADLFRLDHLTTRMRRHAEGLVILSGAAPSRQWRKPVQLMDVVRAAVAEVEDYERVEVRRLPRLAVTGTAVADLTHLVAELLENATVFSPPHTAVQVHGERVANGFTLEIHDRGLGMTAEALLDANLRLAETPEFELSDTDRLGLFVVSRLARRQGVRVSLQTSPYGGTTAVVFIPAPLLTDPAGDGGPDAAGRTGDRESAGSRVVALATAPVSLPPARRGQTPVLDGPVELEAPLGSLEEDEEGLAFHRGPAAEEEHQQAHDSGPDDHRAAPGRSAEPQHDRAPLPRRRSPVLVSDRGRRVEGRGERGTARPEERTRPETADGAGQAGGGLPRRVRQASLAPQLRTVPPPRGSKDDAPAGTEPERDAEEVRARMASLQRGWQRGRAQNGEYTAPAEDAAPGTRTEGDGR
ncbi:nitrate- and nitrite sensing domain-containing protein [Streptomyces sp. NPDC001922]|uniref:nitrate- and nitrite sensing domain-containing protein n=1 Tax=Streptomyces sp. NPDC001922 TaxID=3364624 RepID=UPI0036C14973